MQIKYLSTLIIVLMLAGTVSATSDLKIKNVDFSTPVDQLPYDMSCFDSKSIGADVQRIAVEFCADATYRFLKSYCNPGEDCKYVSAITFYELPSGAMPIDEYRGPLSQAKIWDWRLLALSDDSLRDLVITRTVADTILLESITYGCQGRVSGSTVIQAAVGYNVDAVTGWRAVVVSALAEIDVNNDSYRELIYSRSAKPDSAFQRGVIAYDLRNKRELWLYPTADAVTFPNFHVVDQSRGKPILVFNTVSCANAYSSINGMDSEHAYIIGINSMGRELWRHEVGDAFFYPTSVVVDINGDGSQEVLVTHRIENTLEEQIITVDCYNPINGSLLKRSEAFVNREAYLFADHDSSTGTVSILVSGLAFDSEVITRLDSALQIIGSCSGASLLSLSRITRDGRYDLLVRTKEDRIAVLDDDFSLLGRTSGEPPNSSQWQRSLVVPLSDRYLMLSVAKKPYWKLFYSRHKWPLAMAFAAVMIAIAVVAGRRLTGVYFSLQGLPSIDTMNAMVMVLNRKRTIVYHNRHPLTVKLLGENSKRRQKLSRSMLARYPEMMSFLNNACQEQFTISQELFEIEFENESLRIWVSTYPHLGRDQRSIGKIIFIEDLGAKANLRKAFLNDDMQRIVHGMKTRLGAISCGIGNMKEDPALSEVAALPQAEHHLNSLADQTNQIARMCERILHYASNRRPRFELADINVVLELAIGSVTQQVHLVSPEIVVAKELQVGLPLLMIDGEQIGEALHNLLSNAARAVKNGGVITVRSRMAGNLLNTSSVRVGEIEVQDTGTGIEPEDLERIWGLGFSRSGSTGVGLALVKEIIENHGGTVCVESVVGKGSLFTIRIPVDHGGK